MINLSDFKQLILGGISLKELKLAGTTIWKAITYKNWARYATESDGVTIYNGGLGYKNGYRIRSNGDEAVVDNGTITGYVPVKAGDVVRIFDISKAHPTASGTAINVYNASYTCIGQAASNGVYGIFDGAYIAYSWGNGGVDEGDGVFRWIVPPAASGIAFIRVSIYVAPNDPLGAKLIVTLNEEIK